MTSALFSEYSYVEPPPSGSPASTREPHERRVTRRGSGRRNDGAARGRRDEATAIHERRATCLEVDGMLIFTAVLEKVASSSRDDTWIRQE